MKQLISLILSFLKMQTKQSTSIPIYVTEKEFLKGRELEYPLNKTLTKNMKILLEKVNILRHKYDAPFVISSGYRPGHYNKIGATKSAHLTCQAIDIVDNDKRIKNWLLDNVELLTKLDLYMESPNSTPTWVHLQTRATKHRIFLP